MGVAVNVLERIPASTFPLMTIPTGQLTRFLLGENKKSDPLESCGIGSVSAQLSPETRKKEPFQRNEEEERDSGEAGTLNKKNRAVSASS